MWSTNFLILTILLARKRYRSLRSVLKTLKVMLILHGFPEESTWNCSYFEKIVILQLGRKTIYFASTKSDVRPKPGRQLHELNKCFSSDAYDLFFTEGSKNGFVFPTGGKNCIFDPLVEKSLECINTWINKSWNWHIDGVANKSPVWFFMSTNLQKKPVKISWHSDVWSTSYSDLSEYAELKCGRTDTEDAERSGRPNEVVTPETIKKVHQIVFENRKLKLCEIPDTLKISYGSVYAILHEYLSMWKLLSKWVPCLLTVDQKRQRVIDCERCLELFRRNKPNFLRRYVTMDETWIHHYTPESKRSSAEWTAVGEKRPKRPKTEMWAGKVMDSVFWDAHGVLFFDYLEKGKTINSERDIGQLMRLKNEIGEKRL